MDGFGKTIIAILIGWLLGLLSPPIVEWIQRRRRRAELVKSFQIELEGLRLSLASVTYSLGSRRGDVDRELLEVIEPILRSDTTFPEALGMADAVRLLMELSDEQLASHAIASSAGASQLGLKRITVPFLSSQLSSLYLFSPEFQRIALKIYSRLAIINEEIDIVAFNLKKTFDALSVENHAIVIGNLNQSYQFLSRLCRRLIDDVNLLLSMRK
jgi:hypothetical protein